MLTLKGHQAGVTGAVFSPDGKRLITASSDGAIKIWDATTGQELLSLRGKTEGGAGLAISPDGRRISAGNGSSVQVWEGKKQ